MKRLVIAFWLTAGFLPAVEVQAAEKTGKALYDYYCASCHPDGGNVVMPDKNLYRMSREAKGIREAKDVVARMRKPSGPRMPRFDKSYISDEDAGKIGEYVVNTFK